MDDISTEHLTVSNEDGVQLVSFRDEQLMDPEQVRQIEKELLNIVGESAQKIVVDFENVKSVASSLIGAMVSLRRAVVNYEGELRMASLSGNVLEAFRVTCLDTLIPAFPSARDAIKTMRLPPAASSSE